MQAWERFLRAQETELGAETVQKWLKTLKIIRFDACNLYLEAKDAFQSMWFEEHIRPKIKGTLLNNNRRQIKVHLQLAASPTKATKTQETKGSSKLPTPPRFTLTFDGLDPYCTFDHYITSEANQLTVKLFETIVESENRALQFNPFYIHGVKASGKTHLLMATAIALKQKGVNVTYSRAETFTDHVVSAIRAGEMSMFRQAYRNTDVLIIDDVHVFSKKAATQEEFFHTFNTLHVAGKQIILSANCAPNELQFIEPRLISRFEWGISIALEPPSPRDLHDIVLQKAQAMHYPLHNKVIEFLLETFENGKALNRALEALILRSHLNRTTASSQTVPTVKQILSDLILEEQRSALTTDKIIQGVAQYFGIKNEDIQSKSQTRDCVLPRQIAMHLCRTILKMPFIKIGDLFKKDHSTVMSSVKLIQKAIDTGETEISTSHRAIMKQLKNANFG